MKRKIGEPTVINGKKVQLIKAIKPNTSCYNCCFYSDRKCLIPEITHEPNSFYIEIKQNKEDMEEKKQKMDKLVTDYSANKITYKEFEKSIVELYADKHTEVNKPKLKEFDLEAAKAGKPVFTRDGRKARIICFDRKFINDEYNCPILALIKDGKDEYVYSYTDDGLISKHEENGLDLMMLPEKKEGWIKVRKDVNLYATKEEADRKMIGNTDYVSAKVEWEE